MGDYWFMTCIQHHFPLQYIENKSILDQQRQRINKGSTEEGINIRSTEVESFRDQQRRKSIKDQQRRELIRELIWNQPRRESIRDQQTKKSIRDQQRRKLKKKLTNKGSRGEAFNLRSAEEISQGLKEEGINKRSNRGGNQ